MCRCQQHQGAGSGTRPQSQQEAAVQGGQAEAFEAKSAKINARCRLGNERLRLSEADGTRTRNHRIDSPVL